MSQTEQMTESRTKLDVQVRKATKADVRPLTSALARAFDDDPFINWMAAQDERRARRVRYAMDLSLRKLSMPYGEVYTTDQT
ncbi:MAG: hypothetical protein ABI305_09225, partial [Tepidiformaceae bacterium]